MNPWNLKIQDSYAFYWSWNITIAPYLQIEDLRLEISRREQEILQMATKMKTLEEQHQDYQKHIAVLKESLCAKEEHYTMLQTDVSSVHSQANRKVHISLRNTMIVCAIHYNIQTQDISS